MRRFAATVRTDLALQFRNGFHLAAAIVVIASVLLLRSLPAPTVALLLPVVLLQNVAVNTFYFVAGLLLLERGEGSFTAQSVTPLRVDEYVGSKVLTLSGLSLVESLLIAGAVDGPPGRTAGMGLGIALASVLLCLGGVVLAARYESINEFIMPSVVCTSLLLLPMLGHLGFGSRAFYLAHPMQGPFELIRGDASSLPGGIAYATCIPLLWTVPFWMAGRAALRRLRGR